MRAPTAMADAVLERRLRPLYDAVESGNHKAALKLANTLLQKHGSSQHLKMLKALTLERMGKKEEALAVCLEVKAEVPRDLNVLGDLDQVLSRLGRLDDVVECHEIAAAKYPDDLDLNVALFHAYIRRYDYVKQQLVSMRLYKKYGEERYLLWAICSLDLQATKDKAGRAKLLQLSEALLRKRLGADGFQDLESLLMFVSILQQQEKYTAALELIEGSPGKLFTIESERLQLQGSLLMQLHHFDDAVEVYAKILLKSPDDWATLLAYLDAYLRTPVRNESAEEHAMDELQSLSLAEGYARPPPDRKKNLHDMDLMQLKEEFQHAQQFLIKLQSSQADMLQRGPFLAIVELEHRKLRLSKSLPAKSLPAKDFAESIVTYFARFGHMVSFASDVKAYALDVEAAEKAWLAEALGSAATTRASTAAEQPVRNLRSQVAAFQVQEQLEYTSKLASDALLRHSARLAGLYRESLPLSTELDEKERGHGEELIILSVNCLAERDVVILTVNYWQLYCRTRDEGYLLEAILVLEHGLSHRRFSPQFKLMVISLYGSFGATEKAWQCLLQVEKQSKTRSNTGLDLRLQLLNMYFRYELLEIKHIMLETMSHHIVPFLLDAGHWKPLESLYNAFTKFHDTHSREAADFTIMAYRHSTYGKVREFVEFKERLEQSFQRQVVQVEAALMDIKRAADHLTEVEVLMRGKSCTTPFLQDRGITSSASPSFNEDLSGRPWWSPSPDYNLLHESEDEAGRTAGRHWHRAETKEEVDERHSRWLSEAGARQTLLQMLHVTTCATDSESQVSASKMRRLLSEYPAYQQGSQRLVPEARQVAHVANGYQKEAEESAGPAVSLTTATFATAAGMLEMQDPTHAQSDGPPLVSQFENLGRMLQLAIAQVSQGLIEPSGWSAAGKAGVGEAVVCPPQAVLRLSRLVNEVLAWLVLCSQVWAKSVQSRAAPAAKRKKKKAGKEGAEAMQGGRDSQSLTQTPPIAELRAALLAFFSVFRQSLVELERALRTHLARPESDHVPLPGLQSESITSSTHPPQQEGTAQADCVVPGVVLRCLLGSGSPSEEVVRVQIRLVKELVDSQQATLRSALGVLEGRRTLLERLEQMLSVAG
eukprot:SM000072S21220  [mRNA]  locus=s72:417372:423440:+ [translate_table: standard]